MLSAVDPRHKSLNEQAKFALAKRGRLLAHVMQYSDKHISALSKGKAGFEIDKKLATEVAGLWEEIKSLAVQQPPRGRILRNSRGAP